MPTLPYHVAPVSAANTHDDASPLVALERTLETLILSYLS